jgi:hypothetical protein
MGWTQTAFKDFAALPESKPNSTRQPFINRNRRPFIKFYFMTTAAPPSAGWQCACNDGVWDLVVIGAGPHALSLVSRLLLDRDDLYTDKELARLLYWNRRLNGCLSVARSDALERNSLDGSEDLKSRMLVIDKDGEWMAQWRRSFKALQIKHLRSPVHVHPDPLQPVVSRMLTCSGLTRTRSKLSPSAIAAVMSLPPSPPSLTRPSSAIRTAQSPTR